MRLIRSAPAKINFSLHVTGRRADGYHELETLVGFCDVADRLTIAAGEGIRVAVQGPFEGAVPAARENLVWRAADVLQAASGSSSGAIIGLEKNLPAGAGFGGGSSDAATVLLALNEFWGLDWSLEDLTHLAISLGADVPLCLHRAPVLATGIGEIVTPGPRLPDMSLVLLWPGRSVSTARVFESLPTQSRTGLPVVPGSFSNLLDFAAWLAATRNDLQDAACAQVPEIQEAIALLKSQEGCRFARMSGSGSGCFGLFASSESGAAAARDIHKRQPRWWIQAAGIA